MRNTRFELKQMIFFFQDFRIEESKIRDRVLKSKREFYLNFRSWKKFNKKLCSSQRFYFNLFHWRVIFLFFRPLEIRVKKLIKKKKKCWIRKGEAKWMEREVAITRKNREDGLVKDIEYRLSGRRSRIRIPSRSFHFSSSRYTISATLLLRVIPHFPYH